MLEDTLSLCQTLAVADPKGTRGHFPWSHDSSWKYCATPSSVSTPLSVGVGYRFRTHSSVYCGYLSSSHLFLNVRLTDLCEMNYIFRLEYIFHITVSLTNPTKLPS